LIKNGFGFEERPSDAFQTDYNKWCLIFDLQEKPYVDDCLAFALMLLLVAAYVRGV